MASTSVHLSDREIEQEAMAAADAERASSLALGMTPGRAEHNASLEYDRVEGALKRARWASLNSIGTMRGA